MLYEEFIIALTGVAFMLVKERNFGKSNKRGKRILFILGGNGANPFHASLARSLNADFLSTSKKGQPNPIEVLFQSLALPNDYDIYFSETIFIIPAIARILGRLPKHAKIINLMADPILYNIKNKIPNRIPAIF